MRLSLCVAHASQHAFKEQNSTDAIQALKSENSKLTKRINYLWSALEAIRKAPLRARDIIAQVTPPNALGKTSPMPSKEKEVRTHQLVWKPVHCFS